MVMMLFGGDPLHHVLDTRGLASQAREPQILRYRIPCASLYLKKNWYRYGMLVPVFLLEVEDEEGAYRQLAATFPSFTVFLFLFNATRWQ